MLLKLYFLHEKSPKKCQEIEDIVAELRACLVPSEMPRSHGIKPLRACDTRFIAHKLAALERVVNQLVAYSAVHPQVHIRTQVYASRA